MLFSFSPGQPDSRYIRVETCMFMVKLPQYTSLDVMLEKLRYAIHYREDPLSGWEDLTTQRSQACTPVPDTHLIFTPSHYWIFLWDSPLCSAAPPKPQIKFSFILSECFACLSLLFFKSQFAQIVHFIIMFDFCEEFRDSNLNQHWHR